MTQHGYDYVDDPKAAPWYLRHHGRSLLLAFVGVPAVLVGVTLFLPSLAGLLLVLIVFVPVALSAVGMIRGRRERLATYRRRTRRCLDCGYSLVGNVSGVCPECGTPDLPA